jgi:hypothetical protein
MRLRTVLADALASLDSTDRWILVQIFRQGRHVRSLAAELELTPAAAYARFERLKRRLRDLLVQHGVSADNVRLVLEAAGIEAGLLREERRGEERRGEERVP